MLGFGCTQQCNRPCLEVVSSVSPFHLQTSWKDRVVQRSTSEDTRLPGIPQVREPLPSLQSGQKTQSQVVRRASLSHFSHKLEHDNDPIILFEILANHKGLPS